MIKFSPKELLDYVKQHMQAPLPQRLYKFRTVEGAALKSIIKSQTLRFSNPLDWNDPFDGQIRIDTKNTQAEIAKFLKYHQPTIARARAREIGKKAIHSSANWHRFVNHAARERMALQGLCCFTSEWSPILQWSHYANSHKGVALGFDPRQDLEFFGSPLKVNYVQEYPVLNYVNQSVECLAALLTAKSVVWAHEKEIRIWQASPGDHAFNPAALTDITFGVRCQAKQISEVRGWCDEAGLAHVKFFKAQTAEWEFALERTSM